MPDSRVTIKIPRTLYERIKLITANSSFSSSTDFIVYVLRDLVSGRGARSQAAGNDGRDELSRYEIEAIRKRLKSLGYLLVLVWLASAESALAYVGPGAGFALGGAFVGIFAGIFAGLFAILTFPFRFLVRSIRRRKTRKRARV